MLFTLQFKICALSSRGGALPPPVYLLGMRIYVSGWLCISGYCHLTLSGLMVGLLIGQQQDRIQGGGLNFVLCARAELFIWNFTYVKFCNQTPFFGVFSLKWKIKILRLRGLHFLLTKLPQRNSVFSTNSKFDNWSCKPKSNRIHGLKYLRSPIHWVAKIKGLENQC